MAFDEKTKELARAHDSVDRLRDIQDRIKRGHEGPTPLHDLIIRGAILVLTAYLVAYAFEKL